MAQCEEQGFSGVTSEHLAMFLEKGQELGLPGLGGAGHTGQATHMGVTIRWAYDPSAKTLAVQCTESPMLLPCALINSKIQQAVSSVLSRTGMAGEAAKEQA